MPDNAPEPPALTLALMRGCRINESRCAKVITGVHSRLWWPGPSVRCPPRTGTLTPVGQFTARRLVDSYELFTIIHQDPTRIAQAGLTARC
jgi:hypothetical protein